MTIVNHTEFVWHDVFAFNCVNPVKAPAFQDWTLDRTYMSPGAAALHGANETSSGPHADGRFLSPATCRERAMSRSLCAAFVPRVPTVPTARGS